VACDHAELRGTDTKFILHVSVDLRRRL
jgi:hypothetical protein